MRSKLLLVLPLLCGCQGGNLKLGDLDVGRAVSAATTATKALTISAKEEEALGREAAANLAAKYKLASDEKLTRYVSLVGRSVARKAARKDVTWRFGVLESPHANAYAAPGGYIFVTRGLVELLGDESELAGVLAHEVQHVDRKHAVKSLRRAGLLQAGAQLSNRAELEALAGGLIGLLERGYGRGDELEADKEGVHCLGRAGYDATGLLRALERHDNGGKNDPFAQRHPPFDVRVDALAKLTDLPEGGARLEKRFRSRVRK